MAQLNNYKNSKWADQIISLQKADGSWGYFHTLSNPTASKARAITTEQALRRLKILGFTEDDEPIRKALAYLENCINKQADIPDRREKFRDWDIFKVLMLATWLKIFDTKNPLSDQMAKEWANIIEKAFSGGYFNQTIYTNEFYETFGVKPHNGRTIDFATFYQVSILRGLLKQKTEELFINHIINNKQQCSNNKYR
jgi:hypothetical protein